MEDQRQKYDTHQDFGLALMTLTWRHKRKEENLHMTLKNLSQFIKEWLIVHQPTTIIKHHLTLVQDAHHIGAFHGLHKTKVHPNQGIVCVCG